MALPVPGASKEIVHARSHVLLCGLLRCCAPPPRNLSQNAYIASRIALLLERYGRHTRGTLSDDARVRVRVRVCVEPVPR